MLMIALCCKDEGVLQQIGNYMQTEFGDMSITKGNVHDFLGMKIVVNNDKTITIGMVDQIKKVVEYF